MGKKILSLNIGASAVTLSEYEAQNSSTLKLLNYGKATLGAPIDSANAATVLPPALHEIMRETGIRPGPVTMALPGQMVFPRYAAIPMAGGASEKFEQLVRYEIEQNIPFPIDEMVCDRQILGDTENGDKAVMIVAAKIEQVEALTNAVAAAGFRPEIVDVAPIALTNALKASAYGQDGCTVILDIGAKTTSLVIVEGEKIYNRSIPVAGNTLTKEIAQATGLSLDEAEQLKVTRGYVSLGGVTEDEDQTMDRVSKVCRAVLTRLNAEISRSINFYRSQQGGNAPKRLCLTGGTAMLPQLDAFFADSLGLEVVFFNPFESMAVAPSINSEKLSGDIAVLAAGAGLALHAAGGSAISINLLPPSLVESRAEVARIPFVIAGALGLVAASVCLWLGANHAADTARARAEAAEASAQQVQSMAASVKAAETAAKEAETRSDELARLIKRRGAAVSLLNAVKKSIGDGLWIESWTADGKVTIRGWKDRVKTFAASNAAKEDGKALTAPEIVAARLRRNPAIDSEQVKVTDMSTFGKDAAVEQFTVEVKSK